MTTQFCKKKASKKQLLQFAGAHREERVLGSEPRDL